MYVLTRYVVWEVLKYFLAALLALTLVVTLGMGVQRGIGMGLPPAVMLRIMPIMLPETLGITIPVAILFAVCSVFGRMTGTNEVVALKSLGISPMAVVWPVAVLTCFFSLGTIWTYEIAATWGKLRLMRTAYESIEVIAYNMLRTNLSCSYPPNEPLFSINVKRVDGRTLVRPTITIFAREGNPKTTIEAATAELGTNPQSGEPNISVTDAEFDIGGKSGYWGGTMTRSLPIPLPGRDVYHRDWVALREIPGRVAELETRVRQLQELREANKALGRSVAADDAEISSWQFKVRRLRAESYRRWANGFTCLCFALIGMPVAMFWRHADVLTNFFACFLPILAIYYPLLVLSDELATSGNWPPATFWMGDVLLLGVSVILLRRIIRR